MWQLFALGSVLSYVGEDVTDKFALAAQPRIDAVLATFVRIFCYVAFTALVGWWGIFGNLELYLHPLIFLMAAASIPSTFFYTYLFRKIEVTSIGIISYFAPFAYLVVDTQVLHTSFSAGEIAGLCLLVAGGLGFALDTKTLRLKQELSPLVWGMVAFQVGYTGLDAYVFQYVHAVHGVDAASYFANIWGIVLLVLLCILFWQGKQRLILNRASRLYFRHVCISKGFDAIGSVLWAQALTIAAVSQVSAMEGLTPLALFCTVAVVQEIFGLKLNERLGRRSVLWKSGAVSLLVLGSLLVG